MNYNVPTLGLMRLPIKILPLQKYHFHSFFQFLHGDTT